MTIRERKEREAFLEAVLLEAASCTRRELGRSATLKAYEISFCRALHQRNISYQVCIGPVSRHVVLEELIACEICFSSISFHEEELLRFLRQKKMATGFIIHFISPAKDQQIIKVLHQKYHRNHVY